MLVAKLKRLQLTFRQGWWVDELGVGMVWFQSEKWKPRMFLRS